MYTIYGIPNCDTVKKTLNWFNEKGLAFTFHNYKEAGISEKELNNWCEQVGWEILLNKRSTSYRALTPKQQAAIKDSASAIAVMLENNSIIKRPVVVKKNKVLAVGFDVQHYQANIK
jgi:Spx/MgsR family transcriptional regulator